MSSTSNCHSLLKAEAETGASERSSRSLNGGQTRKISAKTEDVLLDLLDRPKPSSQVNPGVVDRLKRGGWVEFVMLRSPFKAHKGGNCTHLTLTRAGSAHAKEIQRARKGHA